MNSDSQFQDLLAVGLEPVAQAQQFLFDAFGISEVDEEGKTKKTNPIQKGINEAKKEVAKTVVKSIFLGG